MRGRAGFTLIEVLVVVLIMAVMGASGYQMLGGAFRLQENVAKHTVQLEEFSKLMFWLSKDLEQYVDRPIRNELGEFEPSLLVQPDVIAMTHLGWSNPIGEKRSQGQRVEYRNSAQGLQRRAWRVLDRDQDSASTLQQFDGVTLTKVEVLSRLGWLAYWPQEKDFLPGADSSINPIAIRISLSSQSLGEVTRLFELPSTTVSVKPNEAKP